MCPDNLFKLDTKGICLICLRKCPDTEDIKYCPSTNSSSTSFSPSEQTVSNAFKVLMRYLNIDILKQCNLSTSFLHRVDGFQREVQMAVKMCATCIKICHEFSLVYKQFEVVRLQLDECVQVLYHTMKRGDKDPERVRDFERTLMQESWNPLRLFHASIADNLRKETIRKCSMRVDKLIPRVTVSKPIPNYIADITPEYAADPGGFEVPICVITETKGDLENEEMFEGPTSFLKVETVFDDAERREEFDSVDTHDEILSINQDDGLQMDASNLTDPLLNDNTHKLDVHFSNSFRSRSGSFGSDAINCKCCEKKYFSQGTLRTHMLTAHTFEHCLDRLPDGTTASSFKVALEHVVNQYKNISTTNGKSIKRRLMCGFCTKDVRDTFNLRVHVVDNHFNEVLSSLPPNPTPMPIYLPEKKFKAKSRKAFHVKSKTTAFKRTGRGGRRASVKGHMGPLYKCPECDKKFTVNACMKRHHKIFHTREGIMKYCCVWCNKAFMTSFNMRLHVNTVHLLEAYHSQIPVGTTKVQLKGVLNRLSKQQAREHGTGNKQKVKCRFCGKLNSDAFFFKNHLIEEHFHEVINGLNEVNGLEGGMAMSDDTQQEDDNEMMQDEETPIENASHFLEMPLTVHSNGEKDFQLNTKNDFQEHHTTEDGGEPHQVHISSGPSQNGILKGLLDHDHGEEEDGSINDLPILEMYDALS